VAGAITIVLAFRAQGKAVQAAGRANGMKLIFATGQQLVHVALMTHIPDEFVLGRLKDAVQRECEFDHPEVGSEMATVLGQDGDQLLADFPGREKKKGIDVSPLAPW